jgi:hypothetical protein
LFPPWVNRAISGICSASPVNFKAIEGNVGSDTAYAKTSCEARARLSEADAFCRMPNEV